MTKTLPLIIYGRPVPKKNNPVPIFGKNRFVILPSKVWRDYEKQALKQLMSYGNVYFDGFVTVTAHYWLPNRKWMPDLVGLLQGTGDLLEKCGLLKNDRYILSWGDSRICGLDKSSPRAEITISEAERPRWW